MQTVKSIRFTLDVKVKGGVKILSVLEKWNFKFLALNISKLIYHLYPPPYFRPYIFFFQEMEDKPAFLPKRAEIAPLKNEYRRNRLSRLSEYLKTKRNQFDDVM